MKILPLTIVVGLGLAIAFWWTHETTPAPTPVAKPAAQPQRSRSYVMPVMASDQVAPTLEPRDPDPTRHEAQEELWQHRRKFATDAKLTGAQWEQFERDLFEVAAIESAALGSLVKSSGNFDDLHELNEALGHDLEERCAAYMTDTQLRVLRSYFAYALIMRVRQLHYVPVVTPES